MIARGGRLAAPAGLAFLAGALVVGLGCGASFAQHAYGVGPPNLFYKHHHFGPVRSDTDADRSCLGGYNAETPYATNTCMPALVGRGFVMTRSYGAAPAPLAGPAARAVDLPQAIAACWAPPFGPSEAQITLRAAFARDGRIIGKPKIAYVSGPTEAARDALRRSLTDALARCAPFRFTPSLGRSIAGRPFAIRFILQGRG